MKLNFRFSNLIGTVYRKGNIVFSADGNSIFSPVGNKVTVYDLKNHKSETLPIESLWNVRLIALAPNGTAALIFNEGGECLYVNLISRTTIHRHYFKKNVRDAKFSPNGKYFVACRDTDAQLFRAPNTRTMQFNPFYMENIYHLAHDTNTCLDWSSDSKFFAVGSLDTQVRICHTAVYKDFPKIYKLSGHSAPIVECFFVEGKHDIYSLDRAGNMVLWECTFDATNLETIDIADLAEFRAKNIKTVERTNDDEAPKKSFYKRGKRFSFRDAIPDSHAQLKCAAFHRKNGLLATGFSNGAFLLHDLPDFNLIHNLSISQHPITSIALNDSGDWIGVASSEFGQLLVWEWQSETYAMKQQGHYYDMNCVAYSPDGQYVATGGQDGKVKIWTLNNGFCFVTLDDHKSSVTGLAWTQGGKALVASSLDGSIRAFDLKRYRNFRTFVAPQPVQFSCVCVDASGDLVCAGGQDVFDIHVWSMQNGKLLDVLSGHEAPISALSFNPAHPVLASCSWDKTIRLWDVFEGKGNREAISLNSDGLALQFSPDGRTLACLTMNCQIVVFEWRDAIQVGTIECRMDLDPGRGEKDGITAVKSSQSKHFQSICFSADGEYIIAGGQSRFICIYNVRQQILVKKFPVTANLSMDNVADFVDRRKITYLGSLADANLSDENDSDREADFGNARSKIKLPGVRAPDLGEREYKAEFRVNGVQFSPTGRSWAACTTEGLLVYSLDQSLLFNPFELEQDVTPAKVRQAIVNEEFAEAVVMAIKLNQESLVHEALERTPTVEIDFVCRTLPIPYVEKLLHFLVNGTETSKHAEFYLTWTHSLLVNHGNELKTRSAENMATLTALQQVLARKQRIIGRICEYNKYGLDYVLAVNQNRASVEIKKEIKEGDQKDEEEEDDQDLMMDTS